MLAALQSSYTQCELTVYENGDLLSPSVPLHCDRTVIPIPVAFPGVHDAQREVTGVDVGGESSQVSHPAQLVKLAQGTRSHAAIQRREHRPKLDLVKVFVVDYERRGDHCVEMASEER